MPFPADEDAGTQRRELERAFRGRRVLVTGGAGFVGSHLVEALAAMGAQVRVADNFARGNPRNLEAVRDQVELLAVDLTRAEECRRAAVGQELVFHLAAKVAGVDYNVAHPAEMFHENALLALQALEAARLEGVERFLMVSSVVVYPTHCTVPTPEDEGFLEDPERGNVGYGWAKRVAEVQARLYHEEYGMPVAIVRPTNCYGPRDNFRPGHSHVIPSIIRRIALGEDPLVVWGDGSQTRSFVYVEDLARGMMLALLRHAVADPVNLGSDEEVPIRELVERICKAMGASPRVVFDASRPGGQPRRALDMRKARAQLGYRPLVPLDEGLRRTVRWYREVLLPEERAPGPAPARRSEVTR